MEPLSKQHVAQALQELALEIEIQEYGDSTATAPLAAERIGTELGSIVKSLVFMVDEKPMVFLVAGDKKADDRKISAYFNVSRKKIKIATAEQCIEHIGYAPGGVAPVGHRHPHPIYIDETLGRYEMLYAAAGSPHTIFPIPYGTLIEVTGGMVVDVVKED
jgi:prolyl-tRNA editing enzyme YbaK/EbsC (Cys-tRNA(Pro) deacylase)